MSRVSWDRYFMQVAHQIATRATCDRRHVGCVLVSPEREILATGYNGSVRGAPHCDDVGHDMLDGHCVRTVHAEVNAIAQAAARGAAVRNATAYVTTCTCYSCFKMLVNADVRRIVYEGEYGHTEHDQRVVNAAYALAVRLVKIGG